MLSDNQSAVLVCAPSRLRLLKDEDLVLAFRSGVNDALVAIYERYSPLIFQRTRAVLRDDYAAQEVVREVFIDAFDESNRFNLSGNVQLRLLQCAYWRIMKRRQNLAEAELQELALLEKEIIAEPFGKVLKEIRVQAGLSIDEAVAGARAANIDPKQLARALGLAIRQRREERQISRKEFCRATGFPLCKVIRLERGLIEDLPITEFVRISCALGLTPEALGSRFEECHWKIRGIPRKTIRCRKTE